MPLHKTDPRERFENYHRNNPEVYEHLDYYANEMIDAGVSKVGFPCVFERVRYESNIKTGEQPYQLPNEFRALYARLWIENNPQHADRIRIRRRKGEECEKD